MQKSNFIPITLIIPVYNMQDYIEDCLQSLVNQTYKNFETVIIDDGSNDKSVEKILSFKDKLKFKLIKQKNAGLGPARNKGIKNASGKYVAFLDSDDEISHFYMEKLFYATKNKDYDLVGFDHIRLRTNNLPEQVRYNYSENLVESFEKIFNCELSSMVTTLLIKKSIFTKNKIYFPELIPDDLNTSYKFFYYAKSFKKVDCYLYLWKIRKSSLTTEFTKKKCNDLLLILKNDLYFLIDKNILNKYKNLYEYRASWLVNHYQINMFKALNFRTLSYFFSLIKKNKFVISKQNNVLKTLLALRIKRIINFVKNFQMY